MMMKSAQMSRVAVRANVQAPRLTAARRVAMRSTEGEKAADGTVFYQGTTYSEQEVSLGVGVARSAPHPP